MQESQTRRISQDGPGDRFQELLMAVGNQLQSSQNSLKAIHDAALDGLVVSHQSVLTMITKQQERIEHENNILRQQIAASGGFHQDRDGDAAAGGGGDPHNRFSSASISSQDSDFVGDLRSSTASVAPQPHHFSMTTFRASDGGLSSTALAVQASSSSAADNLVYHSSESSHGVHLPVVRPPPPQVLSGAALAEHLEQLDTLHIAPPPSIEERQGGLAPRLSTGSMRGVGPPASGSPTGSSGRWPGVHAPSGGAPELPGVVYDKLEVLDTDNHNHLSFPSSSPLPSPTSRTSHLGLLASPRGSICSMQSHGSVQSARNSLTLVDPLGHSESSVESVLNHSATMDSISTMMTVIPNMSSQELKPKRQVRIMTNMVCEDEDGNVREAVIPGRDSMTGEDVNRNSGAMKFAMLDVWTSTATVVLAPRDTSSKHYRNRMLMKAATRGGSFASRDVYVEEGGTCMINPTSPARGLWDFMSLLLVLYDLVAIPMMFLDPPENEFQNAMAWTTRFFWTLDIPMSFMTGMLTPNGSVIMKHYEVAKKYMQTWFTFDCALVAIDWVEVLWSAAADANDLARMGRATRTIRILRMTRLLRLVRIRVIISAIRQRIRSEWLRISMDIGKIMASILSVAHFIACAWCGIASSETKSWLTEFGYNGRYADDALEHRYLMALHWSISQFHGGMDEITPQNFRERLFAVAIFLVAWMMAAAFISGLTSQMTRLHILASHQSRQLHTLHLFLKQSRISESLACRVTRNAQHAITEQERLMPESQVDLLASVSAPLRIELHFEMYSPVLEVHPFFVAYIMECPQVMRKVCHEAISSLLVSKGDVIFNAGEIPAHPKMYIVCSGTLDYIPLIGPTKEASVEMCISEATLWTPWMHRGLMKATSEGRLCCMDAETFQKIVGHFDHSEFDPRRYAKFWVDFLNSSLSNGASDGISDMPMYDQDRIAQNAFEQEISGSSEMTKMFDKRRKSAFMDPRLRLSQRQSVMSVATKAITRRMSVHSKAVNKSGDDSVGLDSCGTGDYLQHKQQVDAADEATRR